MRAMRVHRTAPVEESPLLLDDVPLPVPRADEVLVRIHACAVCRTDLHVIEGDLPETRRPLVPGHMAVGTVEAHGAEVEAASLPAGTRVGIAWLRATCGTCGFCTDARENLCDDAVFTGYHVDGGYAEYATVPAAWAYPIPDDYPDEAAAPLLCAGIIGYRALTRSGIQPGQRLGLYGFGNSAHIVLQLARARGCEVHVASRGEVHQELAREMGAKVTAETLAEGTLDAAILFAPVGTLVPPALRALKRGGTLACAGIHMTAIPSLDYDAEVFGEKTLTSVTANTRADGLGLLEEAARIGLKAETVVYPLAEANEALRDLKAGRVRGSAVLKVR